MENYGRRRRTVEIVRDDLIARREICASHVSVNRVVVNVGH